MECFRCKFYKSGATSNSCSLFECEYFRPFTKESPCTVVSEDYIATEDVEAFVKNIEDGELSDAFWNNILVTKLNTSVTSSPYFKIFFF